MPTGLHTADHIVIVGYFVLLTLDRLLFLEADAACARLLHRRQRIPWWLAGVSFYLTGFSAFSFVAYSEMAYRYGFVAVTLAWSSAVAMAVGTLFMASRWRRARIISPVEFLEARYNKQIRQILAWAGIPLRVIDDGLKIYATGVFVSVGMGYDLKMSIIVSGAVMLLYTFMGGLWAVVVTDYIQFIILTLGVVVLFPLVFAQVGSFGALANGAQAGFLSPIGAPVLAALRARFLSADYSQLQRQLGVCAKVLQRERRTRSAKGRNAGRRSEDSWPAALHSAGDGGAQPDAGANAAAKLAAIHLCRALAAVSSGRADGPDDRGDVLGHDVHSEWRLQRHGERHDRRHLSPPVS